MSINFQVMVSAALLASVALVGCGTETGQTSHGTEQRALVDVATSAKSDQVRDQAAELFYRWYGSNKDRAAAELIVAYKLNGPEAECMSQRGFEWDWRLAAQNAIPEDPLGPAVWTNQPMGRIFSNPRLAAADFSRREAVMNADDLPSGQAEAMADCEEQSGSASDDEIESIRSPRTQAVLMGAWREGLREATAQFGTYDDYARCMAEADIPLLGDQEITAENFQMEVRKHAPTTADLPSADRPGGGETWTEFLGLEAQWLNADWACRADTYDQAMGTVPSFLASFEAQHREQIAELEQYWANVRSEAESLP